MLKLIYTDVGLHMERTTTSLEILVAQRVVLAIRVGQTLHIEPGKASFLLPANAIELSPLEMALRSDPHQVITITPVDDAFVEVSVEGSWIADSAAAHAGMFITAFPEPVECLVYSLWLATQAHVMPIL